jgi:hypothetical protein
MAFHIDCKGRHGLISIENKPASYGATPWECNTCKRTIPGVHIGVLNCERCRCDICPDCWTALLPKIVNASGYPCFWREVQPPHARSTTRMLGCHRRNVCTNGSPAQNHQLCGIDPIRSSLDLATSPTAQCNMCANKQRELEAAQGGQSNAAVSFSQTFPVHFVFPGTFAAHATGTPFGAAPGHTFPNSSGPFPFAAHATGTPFGAAPGHTFPNSSGPFPFAAHATGTPFGAAPASAATILPNSSGPFPFAFTFGGVPTNIFGPTFGPCFGSKSN